MDIFSTLSQQFTGYAQLMRLDRPIGTYLLLWPTLWGLWVAADGFPRPELLVIFVLGVVVMRAAGCVVNDLADRNIDGDVERTVNRPLATGAVSVAEAMVLFILLLSIALYLALQLNALSIGLACIAAVLAISYPFMKRYTYLPQVVLGAAFAMSIPMAFAAQTNSVPLVAWLLYFANLLWTIAYDTIYAIVDRDDDLKIGVKSTAILFGNGDKLAVFGLQILFLATLVLVGFNTDANEWFYTGLVGALCFLLYQQWLIRNRDRDACFQAFLNNHWVGMMVFLGMLLNYGYQV